MRTIPTPPWALLLAGGDGRRLKPLTRQIAGDPRPKQFCAILAARRYWIARVAGRSFSHAPTSTWSW